MSFQWLHMRIQEEADRRKREAITLERLPIALEELYGILEQGIKEYRAVFGDETVESVMLPSRIRITTREQGAAGWKSLAEVEVVIEPDLPGFLVQRGETSTAVELGLLPSNNLYYRDREKDVYLTMEDVTRIVLDRTLFPKLLQ
jgi:hypothetical protein